LPSWCVLTAAGVCLDGDSADACGDGQDFDEVGVELEFVDGGHQSEGIAGTTMRMAMVQDAPVADLDATVPIGAGSVDRARYADAITRPIHVLDAQRTH
jgi:hypothetical protein